MPFYGVELALFQGKAIKIRKTMSGCQVCIESAVLRKDPTAPTKAFDGLIVFSGHLFSEVS